MITNLKSKSRKVAQRKHAAAAKSTVVQSTPPEPGSWEYMFRMLVVFQRTHGHCEVPYCARSGSLGSWLMQQRLAELSGALAPELRLRLGDLGVQFDSHDLTETNRERRWNEMFEALQEFKDGAGHCNVPSGRPEYSRLSQWLYAQRRLYRTDKLRRDRARLLETIGFNLESATRRSHRQPCDQRRQEWDKKWEEKFAVLKAFHEKHGHCKVSIRDASHARLGIWLHLQRASARAGRLLAARREKLEQLGVVFGPPNTDRENRWNAMFEQLQAFKLQSGLCIVPTKRGEHQKLGRWVHNQRIAAYRQQLSPSRRSRLEALGVELNKKMRAGQIVVSLDARWDALFTQLLEYKAKHGDCNVPCDSLVDRQLAYWVSTQRAAFKRGRMTSERQRRLEAAGFVFRRKSPDGRVRQDWEKSFARLVELKQLHADWHAPCLSAGDRELQRWVGIQRRHYRAGTLPADLIQRLESIGFPWSCTSYETLWDRRLDQLLQFRRQHGHIRVPKDYIDAPGLSVWVRQQRLEKRTGKLAPDRLRRLDEAGFTWRPENHRRKELLQALIEFKRQHGHFDVPTHWPENLSLAIWTSVQRKSFEQGRLNPQLRAQLEAIGFNWRRATVSRAGFDAKWERQFAALVAFKKQHGHCRVCMSAAGGVSPPGLAALENWVRGQRTLRRKGRLAPDRQRRLDELGFQWDVLIDPWDQHFAELVEFHREHGHFKVSRNVPETRLLSGWLTWQRKHMQTGKLPKERAARLRALGVVAADPDRHWETQYGKLAEFHRAHGHCGIPAGDASLRGLFVWSRRQPKQRAAGKLSSSQIERLDALDFDWRMRRTRSWDDHFASLQEFKNLHGHCRVSKSQDFGLQRWLAQQRQRYVAGQLSPDKRQRLESLGRDWAMGIRSCPQTSSRSQDSRQASPEISP